MYRIILFLLLIALAAAGATWVADQPVTSRSPGWLARAAASVLLALALRSSLR
jgi:hypothetical protein